MFLIRTLVICLLSVSLYTTTTYAVQIAGEGYGSTEVEAKKAALADLSSAIQVQVENDMSIIEKEIEGKYSSDFKQIIKVKSDLPILGAEYTSLPHKAETLVRAQLTTAKALKIYESKVRDMVREIYDATRAARKSGSKHEIYTSMLNLIDQYMKYKVVAIVLGSTNLPEPAITATEVRTRLRKLEKSTSSLNLAARLVARGITQSKIYIYPATTRDSHEVTQLGSVMKDKLAEQLGRTVKTPADADYYMRGTYEILKDSIELTYQLFDINNNTLHTRVVRLAPDSYKGYAYKPQSVSFDKLLYSGIVVSNDFRVELSTNKGSDGVLYKKGEEVKLFVKANRAGYFYIVGHVLKGAQQYSYLVELNEGQGDRKFVKFINADDANKWVSLGAFDVVPPYGVESLQLVASTTDLVDKVPGSKFNQRDKLYHVSSEPDDSVIRTRALKPASRKETLSAEAVLMFTTLEK